MITPALHGVFRAVKKIRPKASSSRRLLQIHLRIFIGDASPVCQSPHIRQAGPNGPNVQRTHEVLPPAPRDLRSEDFGWRRRVCPVDLSLKPGQRSHERHDGSTGSAHRVCRGSSKPTGRLPTLASAVVSGVQRCVDGYACGSRPASRAAPSAQSMMRSPTTARRSPSSIPSSTTASRSAVAVPNFRAAKRQSSPRSSARAIS